MTLADIAERAGVSKATVSRVFAPPGTGPGVSSATRRRVMRAADELGWRPHRAARTLARRRSALIGALVPGFGGGFIGGVIDGVAKAAQRTSYHVMFLRCPGGEEGIGSALDHLLEMRVEGILFYPTTSAPIEDDRVASELRELPCVLIDNAVDGLSLPLVTGDNVGGMRQVADHLVSLGHERIGYIAGPSSAWAAEVRLSAFRAALRERGLQLPEERVARYNYTWGRALRAAERVLQLEPLPSAVATANDLAAAAMLRVARDMGLQVPGDLALVGYGDTMLSHTWVPPLTTVKQPMEELGEAAFHILLRLVRNGVPEKHRAVHVLPTELIVRGSCGGMLPLAGGGAEST